MIITAFWIILPSRRNFATQLHQQMRKLHVVNSQTQILPISTHIMLPQIDIFYVLSPIINLTDVDQTCFQAVVVGKLLEDGRFHAFNFKFEV